MREYHILLIGAGHLGSRHLQALSQSKLDIFISVVDPSETSLSVAKERFLEVNETATEKEIIFLTSISAVKNNVDFCIIATNAEYRLQILKDLLAHTEVKNILLEKVLFQSSEQLDEACTIIETNEVKAWVNCPRRMQPIYRQLKEILSEAEVSLAVNGSNWGLACNAIHMIDLWFFLNDHKNYSLDIENLSPRIYEGKRKGYKELGGILRGYSGNREITLRCDVNDEGVMLQQILQTPQYRVSIDELKGKCEIENLTTLNKEIIEFKILFQSQLTHIVADMILTTGDCDLTPFTEAADQHRPFLNGLLDFFNLHSKTKIDISPIT